MNAGHADRRRTTFVIAMLLLATLVVVTVLAQLRSGGELGAQGPDARLVAASDSDSPPAPSPGSDSARASDPVVAAESALRDFISVADTFYQDPTARLSARSLPATPEMASEVAAAMQDMGAQGTRQTGTVRVIKVATLSKSETEVTLAACLSTAQTRIVDVSGTDQRAEQSLDTRSMHHYTVTLVEGRWLVSSLTFPDNADC